jgi:hypothetical protein
VGYVTFIGNNGSFSETIGTNKAKQGFSDLCPIDPLCIVFGNKNAGTGAGTIEPTPTDVKCYPTIFNDQLHLDIPALDENGSINITLTDLTGKIWRSLSYKIDAGTEYSETIGTSDLPTGMFLMHVMRGQQTAVFKAIKN